MPPRPSPIGGISVCVYIVRALGREGTGTGWPEPRLGQALRRTGRVGEGGNEGAIEGVSRATIAGDGATCRASAASATPSVTDLTVWAGLCCAAQRRSLRCSNVVTFRDWTCRRRCGIVALSAAQAITPSALPDAGDHSHGHQSLRPRW